MEIIQTIFYLTMSGTCLFIAYKYSQMFREVSILHQASQTFRYALDVEDFACLVRGGTLEIADSKRGQFAKIILKDIGFIQMEKALENAQMGKEIYKDHTKII